MKQEKKQMDEKEKEALEKLEKIIESLQQEVINNLEQLKNIRYLDSSKNKFNRQKKRINSKKLEE